MVRFDTPSPHGSTGPTNTAQRLDAGSAGSAQMLAREGPVNATDLGPSFDWTLDPGGIVRSQPQMCN